LKNRSEIEIKPIGEAKEGFEAGKALTLLDLAQVAAAAKIQTGGAASPAQAQSEGTGSERDREGSSYRLASGQIVRYWQPAQCGPGVAPKIPLSNARRMASRASMTSFHAASTSASVS
jgi:hypothetical protein